VLCDEDYYQILGIARDADEAAIKKAFKKLSVKFHPDKNRDDPEEAEKQFAKVANAYEVLIDPEQRQVYNQHGEEGLQKRQQQQQPFMDMFGRFWSNGQQGEQHEDLWAMSDVTELTMAELSKYYRRNEVWIIFFYKSNERESKNLKDLTRDLATRLFGIVKVAAINCVPDRDEALCEEFVMYDTPKYVIVPANFKAEPITHEGLLTYERISAAAINQMESFVSLVNDENYDSFLKEHSNTPIVLTFTQKKQTPAILKALSKEYKGKLTFGEVRITSQKLVENYKITQFPTMLVVTDGTIYEGVRYQEEMTKLSIKNFLRDYAYTSDSKTKKKSSMSSGVSRELTASILRAGTCGPNEISLCFLAIVDEQSDNSNLLNILSSLAVQYAEEPIKFFYVGSKKIDYLNTFEELGNLPRITIVKPKRSRFVDYDGEIDEDKMNGFVEMVISGSGNLKKMKGDLNIEDVNEDL
jgi:DnaJ family protein C protein 16